MAQTKLDVSIMNSKPRKKAPQRVIRNLDQLIAIVESKGLDVDLTKAVLDVIKGYPEGSLDFAYGNLNSIIARCQKNQPKINPNQENS